MKPRYIMNQNLRWLENHTVLGNLNRGNLGDGVDMQPPMLVSANNQAPIENHIGDILIMQPLTVQRMHDYYRDNMNIVNSDRPLVLPLFPLRNTFVVTSTLMKMLTTRGLFLGRTRKTHMLIQIS